MWRLSHCTLAPTIAVQSPPSHCSFGSIHLRDHAPFSIHHVVLLPTSAHRPGCCSMRNSVEMPTVLDTLRTCCSLSLLRSTIGTRVHLLGLVRTAQCGLQSSTSKLFLRPCTGVLCSHSALLCILHVSW